MDKGPGGPWSMGLQRVGHDWATNTHTHAHTLKLIMKKILSQFKNGQEI